MQKFLGRYKGLFIFPLLLILSIAFLFCDVTTLCAHSPHDVIDVLELSPTYDRDKTLFVAMSGHLRKSTDAGFSWKELVNGLDNAHRFASFAISPSFHADKTLFVSSYRDGIYRSQDGGASWMKVNNGLGTLSIDVLSISDVYYDGIVLAAGVEEGLFKTPDGGERWYPVINNVKITAIAFFPELNNGRILAGDHAGNLYLSKDRGETWKRHFHIPDSGCITAIGICPNVSSNDTFFVGTEKRGVFRTNDGGASFLEINKGLSSESNIRSLAISPQYQRDSTVFASTWYEAVFCSKDGGDTWEKYGKGITWDPQANTEQYWSPYYRDVRISKAFAEDRTIFLGGFDGLFKTTDAGQSWVQMETLPVRLIMGLGVSPRNGDDSSIAITTYGGGAYITHDQGLSWAIINRGLGKTRLSDIVFSPDYPSDKTIFSAERGYLLRSKNHNNTWDKSLVPKKTSWRRLLANFLRRLRVPGSLTNTILAKHEKGTPFATVIAVSPNFASDRTLFFGTRRHGIFRSVNGGLSNAFVWDAMWRTTVSLAISPDFQIDGTVFAGIRGAGVYKTADGGDTWQPANKGLSFVEMWKQSDTIRLGHRRDISLVMSPHYGTDKTVFVGSSSGLFKTTDGANSWQRIEGRAYGGDSFIIGMAISPNYENDQQLIVSVKGKGLFRTDNGGTTLVAIGPDLINNNHRIERLAFSASYAADNTIYATSYEELFQSSDGGNTWKMITRPVRYENHREVIHYEGKWKIVRGDSFSASRITHSDTAGSEATLSFVGTGITWIGTTSNDQGLADLYIDGNYMATVDQYSRTPNSMVRLYSFENMAYGPHEIRIEVLGKKNSKSTGYRIEIDALDIEP